jgi:uncharacterized membrane protein YfhO
MRHKRQAGTPAGFAAPYTVVFLILACAFLGAVHLADKELLWFLDGLDEDYPIFVYIGQWIKSAAASGHLQMWNYGIGYGADTIVSIAEWAGDPFFLISALLPENILPTAFELGTIARLYLAGLAFGFFMRRRKIDSRFIAAGCLFYAFSGYLLLWGATRHPFFIDPAIILPLVLLGADKIFDKESPLPFICGIFLSFFVFFYWAYMISIFLLLYCLLRYFTSDRQKGIKDFACLVGVFLGYYVIGALMACVVLIPVLSGHTSMKRDSNVPLFFDDKKTLSLVTAFFGVIKNLSLSKGTTVLPPTPALLILYFCAAWMQKRPERIKLACVFGCLALFTLIPWFGSALNGFSYSTDRWAFAFSMGTCCIATYGLQAASEMDRAQWRKAFLIIALIFCVLVGIGLLSHAGKFYIASAVLLPLSAVLVWTFVGGRAGVAVKRSLACAGPALLCIALVALAMGYGKGSLQAVLEQLPSTGSMSNSVNTDSGRYALVHDAWQDDLGRVDWIDNGKTDYINSQHALLYNMPAVEMYTSLFPTLADQFRTGLALPDAKSNRYATNDSRAFLETVSGVGAFVANQGSPLIPYGFDTQLETASERKSLLGLYTSSKNNSIVFAYDAALSRSDYNSLSPIEKQESLLQSCVLEDSEYAQASVDKTTRDALTLSSQELTWTLDESKSSAGVTLDDGTISVTQPNAQICLSFTGLPDSETYLYFQGFMLEGNEKTLPDYYNVNISTGTGVTKSVERWTPKSNLYTGKNTWLTNVGYTSEAQTEIIISFPKVGKYSYKDISVLCQPMSSYKNEIENIDSSTISNLDLGVDEITFNTNFVSDQIAYLAVQYSPGWKAYVDGSEVPILQANVSFMGLDLSAGNHEVRLVYETPGLKAGLAATAVGIAALIVVFLRRRIKSKHA